MGHFTLTAARLVGPTGLVIAIEPAPAARSSLERSVATNGFAHVLVSSCAIGAERSTAEFTLMGNGDGLSSFAPANAKTGHRIAVQVETLDRCVPKELLDRVALVKMDVEGAEYAALRGATSLLTQGVPLLIEIEDDHLRRQGSSAAAVYELLAEYGYSGYPTPGPSPNVLFKYERRASRNA